VNISLDAFVLQDPHPIFLDLSTVIILSEENTLLSSCSYHFSPTCNFVPNQKFVPKHFLKLTDGNKRPTQFKIFCLHPWLYSPLDFCRFGSTLWTGIRPSQGRYLYTEQHKQYKPTQTSMPRVGFEPTIPVFERAKTVYA
jgi:hypothetical protein